MGKYQKGTSIQVSQGTIFDYRIQELTEQIQQDEKHNRSLEQELKYYDPHIAEERAEINNIQMNMIQQAVIDAKRRELAELMSYTR